MEEQARSDKRRMAGDGIHLYAVLATNLLLFTSRRAKRSHMIMSFQ